MRSRKGREADEDGTVSFIARYSHNGTAGALEETSQFRRIDGRWLYWDRLNEAAAPRQANVGRNDPCPCGSGKKYKKCCS
ncbi:YchJ family metal-binding protein [Hoeflea alexandrii]|uniref:YchJ family metal-binding protein n=1 Tax=Hoeflea alexandrii TaxID=288436 RepID=UPI002270D910|nr:YchJ family metal-binding protein [Hoeflea alexandrii]MCY0152795.1 YchJ family metal-binding protein [Hoeflea alexandrii]